MPNCKSNEFYSQTTKKYPRNNNRTPAQRQSFIFEFLVLLLLLCNYKTERPISSWNTKKKQKNKRNDGEKKPRTHYVETKEHLSQVRDHEYDILTNQNVRTACNEITEKHTQHTKCLRAAFHFGIADVL